MPICKWSAKIKGTAQIAAQITDFGNTCAIFVTSPPVPRWPGIRYAKVTLTHVTWTREMARQRRKQPDDATQLILNAYVSVESRFLDPVALFLMLKSRSLDADTAQLTGRI